MSENSTTVSTTHSPLRKSLIASNVSLFAGLATFSRFGMAATRWATSRTSHNRDNLKRSGRNSTTLMIPESGAVAGELSLAALRG